MLPIRPTFTIPLKVSPVVIRLAVDGGFRSLHSNLRPDVRVVVVDPDRDGGCSGIAGRFDVARAYVGRVLVIGSRCRTEELAALYDGTRESRPMSM